MAKIDESKGPVDRKRVLGMDQGKIWMSDDFDAVPPEFLEVFESKEEDEE